MTNGTQQLIRLSGVSKIFNTSELETHALSAVDLQIDMGEYVAITGPSGGGKSTLLSILGLLDTPSKGTYEFSGRAVSGLGQRERAGIRNKDIGFIFQAFNLIGDLSAWKNIELPLTYRTDLSRAERAERVDQAMERVGMSHRRNHLPSQLSGGQQQRIAVARALAGRPSILLADEPTGNLDTANSQTIMELLSDLHAQGTTLCIVTHDPGQAAAAERQIHISDGRITAQP